MGSGNIIYKHGGATEYPGINKSQENNLWRIWSDPYSECSRARERPERRTSWSGYPGALRAKDKQEYSGSGFERLAAIK